MTETISFSLFADLGARHVSTLRAALRLFCEKGYFNTSVHEIVAAGGVSVGFAYHHFTDKAGIARAVYDHLLERMNALLNDIEATHDGAQDRCAAVVRMLFELTEAEPEAMEFIIHARHREFLPSEKSICSTSAFVRMRRFVADGILTGEIKPMDPVVAGALVYGAAIRMVCLRLDGLVPQPVGDYYDELWQNTWAALTTHRGLVSSGSE
ncbi:TetR family transcriptional regulator (plasmid) [Advenella sp. S44]|uniref:TetR/AcrR family transcriptional regulator n=1 Tax=Advenella sp. S44 TaxID=1982755 RepID=UPI000C2AA7F5|nr:TetR/AcrR family transcriptional regulator [Advenella sp. S44]PJX19997.1 TetR family transcriptional regulator [Advenella sp. S44]